MSTASSALSAPNWTPSPSTTSAGGAVGSIGGARSGSRVGRLGVAASSRRRRARSAAARACRARRYQRLRTPWPRFVPLVIAWTPSTPKTTKRPVLRHAPPLEHLGDEHPQDAAEDGHIDEVRAGHHRQHVQREGLQRREARCERQPHLTGDESAGDAAERGAHGEGGELREAHARAGRRRVPRSENATAFQLEPQRLRCRKKTMRRAQGEHDRAVRRRYMRSLVNSSGRCTRTPSVGSGELDLHRASRRAAAAKPRVTTARLTPRRRSAGRPTRMPTRPGRDPAEDEPEREAARELP